MVFNASKDMQNEIEQLLGQLTDDALMLGKIYMYNEAMIPEQSDRVKKRIEQIKSKIDELVWEIRGEYIR